MYTDWVKAFSLAQASKKSGQKSGVTFRRRGGRLAGMLPEMTGLQFLIVGLLFAGPRSGKQLRRGG